MALLTYDWHPQDPTGAVNAYLRGLSIRREREQDQAKQMEALGKNILAAQNEQRLERADQLRLQYQQDEAARRAAKNAPPPAYALPEPTLPASAPPAQAPQTGAQTVLAGTPASMDFPQTVGDIAPEQGPAQSALGGIGQIGEGAFSAALAGAQSAANTPVAPLPIEPAMPVGPASLTNPSDLPTGAGMTDAARDGGLFATGPAAPAPGVVRTGSQEALLPPEVVQQINTIGKVNPKAAQQLHSQATMEAMRQRDRLASAAAKPSVVNRVTLYQSEKGERFYQNPDGTWKDGKEPPQGVAIAKIGTRIPTSQVNGEAIEWLDDSTAVMKKSGKLVRYNSDGELTPVSNKVVKGTFRDASGNLYTQFNDGTWDGGTAPKPGVDIKPLSSQVTLETPSQQIAKAGYVPVAKPGYENVVTDPDGTTMQVWKQGANGRVTFAPYDTKGSIQHLKDGKIIRVMPDGRQVLVADGAAVPAAEQKNFREAMQKQADAEDAWTKIEVASTNGKKVDAEVKDKAYTELMGARRAVGVFQGRYPSLNPGAPKIPDAAAPSAANSVSGDEFKSDTEVIAAAKAGKIPKEQAMQILQAKFGYSK